MWSAVVGHRRLQGVLIGALGEVVIAVGVSWASIPDSGGVIHGCYKATGSAPALKVINTAIHPNCPTGDIALTWNQTGPQGPAGPPGGSSLPDLSRVGTLNWYGGTYSGGSYAFNQPASVAFDGTHMWVTNFHGDSVTELDASNGAWVQTLSGGSYGFNEPFGVAFDGTNIWVANSGLTTGNDANSVTEINATTGAWVRTLSAGHYGFNDPEALAFDGTHIWVTNMYGASVTELDASTGAWVRTLSAARYGLNGSDAVAFDGAHIWVGNLGTNSVTEINASTGALVQDLSGGSYGFEGPQGLAFDGTHLWVTNAGGIGNSVTEINASTGAWVQTLSGGSYGFNQPGGVAFDGTHIWVVNAGGNTPPTQQPSVTEINANTGAWVQTLSGASYDFVFPEAAAFDGTHIWVTNSNGNSVTDIPAG